MNKKYLIYSLFFLLTFSIIPKYNFTPVKIETESSEEFRRPNSPDIIAFNNSAKTSYSTYFRQKSVDEFIILNKSVWGFCIKGERPKLFKVNGKRINLKTSEANSYGCAYQTEHKKINDKYYSGGTILSTLFASLMVLLILVSLINSKEVFLALKSKVDLAFLVFVFIQLLFYLITYPGLFNIDHSHALMLTLSGRYNDWFSYLNPLYLETLYRLGLNTGTVHIPLYIFGICVTYFYYDLVRNMKLSKYYSWFVLLVFCLPPVALMNSFLTRDTLTLYVNLASVFILLNRFYGKRNIPYEKIVFLVLIIIAGTIRREGVLFFCVMLFIYSYFEAFKPKCLFRFAGSAIIVLLISKTLGGFLAPDNNQYNHKQKVTISIAHYIGSIITHDYFSEDYEEDKKIINRYYDYEILKKYHVHYDTLGLHYGARKWRGEPPLDDLHGFTAKLIKENFWLFLKGRALMFKEMLFPSQHLYTFADNFGEYTQYKRDIPLANTMELHEVNNFLGLRDNGFVNLVRDFLIGHKVKFLFSSFISLIVLTSLLLMFSKIKILALISIPFLIKASVMFMLMQKAQFQYFSDIYVIGLILIPFAIYELRQLFFTEKFVE